MCLSFDYIYLFIVFNFDMDTVFANKRENNCNKPFLETAGGLSRDWRGYFMENNGMFTFLIKALSLNGFIKKNDLTKKKKMLKVKNVSLLFSKNK